MNATTMGTSSPHYSFFTELSNRYTNLQITKFKLKVTNEVVSSCKSLQCIQSYGISSNSSIRSLAQSRSIPVSLIAANEIALETNELVADKLQRLVFEFKCLSEPIDRVKRLLYYAAILDPMDDAAKIPENRVTGCTTQVWLDAKMDEIGRMIFRADSDSEISKGFCSCLIWMLDGAEPEEVLKVKKEDLEALNVGLHGKAQSRVNTWHNVLTGMQNRTKALVDEIEAKNTLEPLPTSLIFTVDGINGEEAQIRKKRWAEVDSNRSVH